MSSRGERRRGLGSVSDSFHGPSSRIVDGTATIRWPLSSLNGGLRSGGQATVLSLAVAGFSALRTLSAVNLGGGPVGAGGQFSEEGFQLSSYFNYDISG